MSNVKKESKIIKGFIIFSILLGLAYSLLNISNITEYNDIENKTSCNVFLNPPLLLDETQDILIRSDIYIFPEIKNVLCLNKVIDINSQDKNKIIFIGTNSKVLNYLTFLIFLCIFLFSLNLNIFKVLIYELFILVFLFYNFYYSINFFTINIILFFSFLIYFKSSLDAKSLNIDFIGKVFKDSQATFFVSILLIFLVFSTQFSTHNYETMDWDINSYLVTSMDFERGHLPYEFHYENKPPLLFVIYYFMGSLASGDLLKVKVINDLVLLLCSFNLYYLIKQRKNNSSLALIGSILFISLMSKDWFHPGYSELHSLFFLSGSLFWINKNYKKRNLIIAGILFSFSTLINFGSVIFIVPFLFILMSKKENIRRSIIYLLSFSLPHAVFLLIYYLNDLLDRYIVAIYEIPKNYPRGNASIFNEFGIFVQELSSYSFFLYLTMLFIFCNLITKNLLNKKLNLKKLLSSELLFLLFSLIFYILASMGYQHHLIYTMFFISYSICLFSKNQNYNLLSILVLVTIINVWNINYSGSYDNFSNFNKLKENYPLYEASNLYFDDLTDEDSILALDNYLLLYYIEKGNSSYISHPSLYKEDFVINPLSKLNLVEKDELNNSIKNNPDYIICSNLNEECQGLTNYINIDTKLTNQKKLHYYQDKSLLIYKKNN